MDNDTSRLAGALGDMIAGKGGLGGFEGVSRLLSTDSGRRVVSSLLADGGENVKSAAEAAKRGDLSGVEGIIASIAKTAEGAELLRRIGEDLKK